MNAIYLDHNATAPLKPAVAVAIRAALELAGNPSSVHGFGRAARAEIEAARERVAGLAQAVPREVVFTASATEANNLVLRGAGRRRLIVSAIEHPSVLKTAQALDVALAVVPVDGDGVLALEALEAALRASAEPALLSLMLANNETGVIQPVAEAAKLAHDHGALIHCDAVQAPGRIPLDAAGLGVDYLSLSAHKLAGPKGVGALIVRGAAPLSPQVTGGGQERGRRAGTENVLGIIGFGAAAVAAADDLAVAAERAALRDRLERGLLDIEPRLHVFGANAARLPNTSCLTMPGVQSETQVMAFDLAGFAVSAGSACSSGKVEPSHVLRATGLADSITGCAIRVSLGWNTSAADIDGFIEAWRALYGGLSGRWRAGISAARAG
jgi:cysteine desulfurase